jgi:hypothetical protein
MNNIKEIIRKGRPLFVKVMKVGELDKTKCSHKFLLHNFNDEMLVNVKCYPDGTIDLRGKKEEYRIIVEDKSNY